MPGGRERRLLERQAALPFLEALDAAPPVQAQARLLAAANRDLAAVLHALGEEERRRVYALVSPAKAEELRAEIGRMGHVFLDAEAVAQIARHLAGHISSERPLGPATRYYRPRRPDRDAGGA